MKHVLVEKRLEASLARADQVIRVCRKNKTKLAVISVLLCSRLGSSPRAMQDKIAPAQVRQRIDENRDRHLSFLRRLIETSKGGEEAVQGLVAQRFMELGCEVETLRLFPTSLSVEKEFAADETIEMRERLTVVGRLPGAGKWKSVLFFGHPDGEPVTEEATQRWTRDLKPVVTMSGSTSPTPSVRSKSARRSSWIGRGSVRLQ